MLIRERKRLQARLKRNKHNMMVMFCIYECCKPFLNLMNEHACKETDIPISKIALHRN